MRRTASKILSVLFVIFNMITAAVFPVSAETVSDVGTEIIVDNTDSGFLCTPENLWQASNTLSDPYGADSRVISVNGTSSDRYAKWSPELTIPGYYTVYITWPSMTSAAGSAGLEIGFNGYVDRSRRISQKNNGGCWIELGTYYMAPGAENYVKLSADYSGRYSADAVKFVLRSDMTGECSPECENITSSAGYNIQNAVFITQDRGTGNFSLSAGGNDLYIKGICGVEAMDKTRAAGGNVIRTYASSTATTGAVLDEAQELGLRICLGIWINYTNDETFDLEVFKTEQFPRLKAQIDAFRSHPALLMWGVGNEVAKDYYPAIEYVARYIKSVDPYHPVSTSIAGSNTDNITLIRRTMPHIDLIACNSYKYIGNVYSNMEKALWQSAYLIGEFSIDMTHEKGAQEKTSDGAYIENSDHEKYSKIISRYRENIEKHRDKCLGSFTFAASVYGGTHTWYSIYLEDDHKTTPMYDALYECWNGGKRSNTAPMAEDLSFNGSKAEAMERIEILPGQQVTAIGTASDTDGDKLTYKYEMRKNSSDIYAQEAPLTVRFIFNDDGSVSFAAPSNAGIYRLFFYVYDGNSNIGTANIPFTVTPRAEEDPYILGYEFSDGKDKLFRLEQGEIRFTAKIKDHIAGAGTTDMTLICAVYDSAGEVLDVKMQECDHTTEIRYGYDIVFDLSIPDENCTVKIFAWKDTAKAKSLRRAVIFNKNGLIV